MKHLVVVASPLQLLCATELVISRRWSPDDIHLVVLPSPHERAEVQMEAVVELAEWPNIERPRWSAAPPLGKRTWLSRVARAHPNLDTLVIGEYQLALLRHLVHVCEPAETVLVDDGSVTPVVDRCRRARRRSEESSPYFGGEHHRAARSVGHRLLGLRTGDLDALTYFTIYPLRPEQPDRVEANTFAGMSRLERRPKEIGTESWILGSTLSHNGLISQQAHLQLVEAMVRLAKGAVRYLPHRHEPPVVADWLDTTGSASVVSLDRPVEVALLMAEVMPREVICTASTAVDTLSRIFGPRLPIVAVFPDQAELVAPARRNVAEMRRRFRDEYPSVEVVRLAAGEGVDPGVTGGVV